ncbi:MAG: chemotaxis protein methyltransferase CheR [Gammaproteobacteria bacterium]|jgi:chemotaxis protein methyltransferase CheR|nr:chemotaxis protein methyltransferase CheR [Gammaproteobacteria bacterium]
MEAVLAASQSGPHISAAMRSSLVNMNNRSAEVESRAREFHFTDSDFTALRILVKEMTGINLAESKRELVYGRVSRRLRALGLSSFGAYRELLESGDGSELVAFCNALTTNLTSFFRESHHFDYLRDEVLAPRRSADRRTERIRIWSSACSSGEEPYSIAMTIIETIPDWQQWDIKILATDLDSDILARAQRGCYNADRVKGLEPNRLARFFKESREGAERTYQVTPELANLITFKQINLMHDLPMSGPLDAIFCRNVVIYFDKDTQRALFARIAKVQRSGNLLFLGHSETLFKVSDEYALIGRTIYRRS